VLGIRQSELRKIGLLLPPIDEQGRIAALLRSLDDKIELNQRMNETLEAIARAIFRFRLEDEVPNHTVQITDLVQCVRQSIEPQAHPNEIFDLYSIPAFDHERMPEQVLGLCIKSNKVLVVKGSVLLSKLNPRFPRVWLPTPRTERRAIASGEFLQMLPKPPATREFLYFLFDSEDFQQRFASLVTGTSGSHQRVRPEAFLSLRVGIAAPKSVERFSTVVAPLLQRVVANRSESATLATLRDSLLPKLITGEIRVGSLET
jgi:type I restriction enzyme S subunit